MIYNEILDYVKNECNNDNGHIWKFRMVLEKAVVSGKGDKDNIIRVHMQWEIGDVSTESLVYFTKEILVELAMYSKK